jgi:hypothetical protein
LANAGDDASDGNDRPNGNAKLGGFSGFASLQVEEGGGGDEEDFGGLMVRSYCYSRDILVQVASIGNSTI